MGLREPPDPASSFPATGAPYLKQAGCQLLQLPLQLLPHLGQALAFLIFQLQLLGEWWDQLSALPLAACP